MNRAQISERDQRIAIATAYGEARGQPEKGVAAVLWVILNRAANPRWWGGPTLESVCRKPQQFSCWNAGDPNRARMLALFKNGDTARGWSAAAERDPAFGKIARIARQFFSGAYPSPVGAATHYHADYVAPRWSRGLDPDFVHGAHRFFFADTLGEAPAEQAEIALAPALAGGDVPVWRRRLDALGRWVRRAYKGLLAFSASAGAVVTSFGDEVGAVVAEARRVAVALSPDMPDARGLAIGLAIIAAALILWWAVDHFRSRSKANGNSASRSVREPERAVDSDLRGGAEAGADAAPRWNVGSDDPRRAQSGRGGSDPHAEARRAFRAAFG